MALMNLEQEGRIAKVMALVPEPEAFFCAPDEVDELMRPRRKTGRFVFSPNLTPMFLDSFGRFGAFSTEVGTFPSSRG